MVTIPGADAYSSTIAMAQTQAPLRPRAARAFSEFFLSVAPAVYPKYQFARLNETEFLSPIALD
jgi:hypothetical protein